MDDETQNSDIVLNCQISILSIYKECHGAFLDETSLEAMGPEQIPALLQLVRGRVP